MVKPVSREIELNFAGFSVTNPHKETIIPLLDEVDDTARAIGAVNTVKVNDGKLTGYNTDAQGFIASLKPVYGELAGTRVALFGAGGAARACVKALRDAGATVTIFARNQTKGQALAEEFGATCESSAGDRIMGDEFDIVVNSTPLGMGTNSNFAVLTAPQLRGLKTRIRPRIQPVGNPADARGKNRRSGGNRGPRNADRARCRAIQDLDRTGSPYRRNACGGRKAVDRVATSNGKRIT
jgi:hypothetical protein